MPKVILTDIEGTTSSISFVHRVLFPYAAEHLPDFIEKYASRADVAEQLALVAAESGKDLSVQGCIEQLLGWIEQDKKIGPLKTLQGLVWAQGFESGAFKSHIYPDAAQALLQWSQAGICLGVYSSGSVQAQKLLFGYSEFGDLTPCFQHYFDTAVGAKREVSSYVEICRQLGQHPAEVLFLSDIGAELIAAQAAGLQTIQLVREEDGTVPEAGFEQVQSFDQIQL